ncbi:MAG TPA: hypothetical protein VFM57_00720 [Thermoleophilaceae bacterium]|nr:hypothetical protein [Thermoleophilaceae bacterium]
MLAAALVGAAFFAGCGGDEETPPAKAAMPVGNPSAGSVVQFADCGDWRRGSAAARVATIKELRGQLTPQSSRTATSPLADERAYEILNRACKFETAASLRLYKLYVRAQGFAPLSGE